MIKASQKLRGFYFVTNIEFILVCKHPFYRIEVFQDL